MREPIEVLVVGAGPVGLTAAYELTRRGVRVRLVDAAAGPAATSRAIATHPRTMETYDQIGVLDAMLARSRRITAFTLFQNGRRLARLDADYSASPTRFPFTVTIEQVATEEVLRDALAARGVHVEWGVRLETFRQDPEGVTATLHAGGATETVRVPWLIGTDGGHSTVRKVLDLPLIGESNETWLLADATVDTELPPNSIYLIRTGGGTLMMAPLPGERRWRMLDTVDVSYGGDDTAVAERFSRKLTAGLGHRVRVDTPRWVSVFTAQQRMVPRMRVGRVFVAGDAAHVHSPASGQGMNTGVQEAYNLAWKLALVMRGHAREELLDTYAAERVPIGRALLSSTKRATQLVALKNALASVALPVVFTLARLLPPLRVRMQRTALGRVSGLNLAYPDSPLTSADGTQDTGPRPGERIGQVLPERAAAPGWTALAGELRDLRWTLLAFGGGPAVREAADRYGQWLSVRTVAEAAVPDPAGAAVPLADPGHVLRADLGAAPGSWLLIRPDGYLAARGTSLTDPATLAALALAGDGRAPLAAGAARAAAHATSQEEL
ncbi:FAD-dependent oxidoreductase [Streptomyces sp. TG1A-8]|uniref:FAD-dependent oxidoreductase n=1 Tax=Streptomyces sp. TG1A-8 TaxID=3051385 RepID=UPI00265C21D5|nr:FAD-dependent oxidoreductase [Streptomyces sp. TG1A-8]MDO0926691.1 FAD-dependent oxidoreductase [Streptomyces sp. TG1A-8]